MKPNFQFSHFPLVHHVGTLLFFLCAFWACDLPKIEGPGITDSLPVARFSATPTAGNAPLTVSLANNSLNATAFSWTFGDGATSSVEEPGTHVYAAPGTYSLRLLVTGSDSRTDDTTIVISVSSAGVAPVADFSISNDGCAAACAVNFTSSSTNATTFSWNFGDPTSGSSNTATSANPSHTYTNAGTYTVKLKVQNGALSDSVTKNVTIQAPSPTWIRTFDLNPSPGTEFVKGIAQAANGDIFFAANDYKSVYTAKLTPDGIQSGSANAYNLGAQYTDLFTRYFAKGSSGFYLGGFAHYVASTSSDDLYGIALNADFTLKTHNSFYDNDDGNEIGHGITQTDDGGYLLCGNKTTGTNPGMFFVKINANFAVETRKNILTGNSSNSAIVVLNTSDGYAVIGKALNSATGVVEGCFLRLDDNLNQVGIPRYLGSFAPEDIVDLGDGSFVILGDGSSGGRIIRISSNNTIFWDKEYGRVMRRGLKSSDGAIVTIGSVFNGSFKLALYKIDLSDGGLVWERANYANPGTASQGLYVMETSDGGFLLGGLDQLGGNQRSMVIRTNKNGLIN